MIVFLTLGALTLLLVAARLVRLIASDGLGTLRAPRSHHAELGAWVDRELQR